MLTKLLSFLSIGLVACRTSAPEGPAPSAVLRSNLGVFVFRSAGPGDGPWPAIPRTVSGYEWRMIPVPDSTLSFRFVSFGVEPEHSDSSGYGTMPAYTTLSDVLAHGAVSKCTGSGHPWFTCAWRITGAASARRGQVVVTVRDREVLRQLVQARPAAFLLVVFLAGERVAADSVSVQYEPR
jgi:hypothetical protein